MAKKINIRLDDKLEAKLKDIQAYYSKLTNIEITTSGAVRIAIINEAQKINYGYGSGYYKSFIGAETEKPETATDDLPF